MIKIAHASSREKANLLLKKAKKAKSERRRKFNLLSEEDRAYIESQRNNYSVRERLNVALFDYEHNQFPPGRNHQLLLLIEARLKEIPNCEESIRLKKIQKEIRGE